MSNYGFIVMIVGFCVSNSTAAVQSGDAGWSPRVQVLLEIIFFTQQFFNAHYNSEDDKHWTLRFQSIDGLYLRIPR